MLINCKLKHIQISYLDKYISLKTWENWFEFNSLGVLGFSSRSMVMQIELTAWSLSPHLPSQTCIRGLFAFKRGHPRSYVGSASIPLKTNAY